MAMRVLRGASGGSGLGVVVGEADVPSGVIYRVSGPAGPAGPKGVDAGGALTTGGLASVVSGAPSKGLPVDADVLPLVDSERSGGLAGLSLANLKAAISAAFVTLSGKQVVADKTFVAPRVSGSASSPASITVDGSDPNIGLELQGKGTGVLTYMGHPVLTEAVVHSAGSKVPVDLDEFLLLDSAAGFLPKKLSWANLKAALLAWFGPVTATLSNKDLTAATNKFPTTLVTLAGAQSLTNKTIVSPTITGTPVSPFVDALSAKSGKLGYGTFISNNLQYVNDIAYAVEQGATVVVKKNGTDVTSAAAAQVFRQFNGAPYRLTGVAASDTVTIEVDFAGYARKADLASDVTWGLWGSDFQDCEIELFHGGAWTSVASFTADAIDVFWKRIVTPAVTQARFTLKNFTKTQITVFSLFAIRTGNSGYGNTLFVPRGGGALYGSAAAPPTLSAFGVDADIPLRLASKGSAAVEANGAPVVTSVAVPATATATGHPGQVAFDATHIYVCTAANTWVRSAAATW